MVTSLTEIDNTIKGYILLVMVVCTVIILIIVITGLYFAGSIVRPIRQISGITSKFAKGDFSVRIDNNSDDEIGELCTSINHMADELSSAEAMKNEFISSVSIEMEGNNLYSGADIVSFVLNAESTFSDLVMFDSDIDLQGIIPTQESNPCLLRLLHWQVDSLPLSHLGSPIFGYTDPKNLLKKK
jgi:HAMP domain-containing protein